MTREIRNLIAEFRNAPPQGAFDGITATSSLLETLPDRTRFLDELLRIARSVFLADHGAILSYHRSTDRWFCEASYSLSKDALEEIKGLSHTVIDRARRKRECLLIEDAPNHELTRDSESIREFNVTAVLCAPVFDTEDIWGLIYLDNATIPNAFDQESSERLQKFAAFASIAIQRCEEIVRSTSSTPSPVIDTSGDNKQGFFSFRSPAMRKVMDKLQRYARENVPILLVGETGTGKDYLARWIHLNSPRRLAPFCHIDCTVLYRHLMEPELFGVERNAATGVEFREGRLKTADGGTAFINEIGELDKGMQSKFLNVIEYKEMRRVGGTRTMGIDVRFVCATNRALDAMVAAGEFRSDLYQRIKPFLIQVPTLRERSEDIPQLALHILAAKCRERGRPPMEVSEATLQRLAGMPWEGNVRELSWEIEKGIVLADGPEWHIPDDASEPGARLPVGAQVTGKETLASMLERYEKQVISALFQKMNYNATKTADRLGLPESTLRAKMERLGIERPPRHRPTTHKSAT